MKGKRGLIVWSGAWLGFLFVALGVANVLHLESFDQPDAVCDCEHSHHNEKSSRRSEGTPTHDSRQCLICFLLLIHTHSVTLEPPPGIIHYPQVAVLDRFSDTCVMPQFVLRPLLPRAPPA